MARQVGRSFLGQSGRDSGGFNVEWDGVKYVQIKMARIADGLAWNADGTDLVPRRTQANKELRDAAGEIARDVLIPQMKRTARSAPVPIARAMSETARVKRDRLIAVQVGGVNPPLSGFKRGVGTARRKSGRAGRTSGMREATSRTFRTTLAWGSEFGPLGGRAKPSRGDNVPGRPVNHYKVARNYPRGYWVLPAVTDSRVKAWLRFKRAVDEIVDYHTQGRG